MKRIEELRKQLEALYNAEIKLDELELIPVRKPEFPRMKYAFFPGGNGLFKGIEAKVFPFDGTLILGSNYGCEDTYFEKGTKDLWTTDERCIDTWKGLRPILRKSKIGLDNCFFTNAWPYVRKGAKQMADAKWLNKNNQGFRDLCIEFFNFTLNLMKPRLIVALGTAPAAFLGHFRSQELGQWKSYTWKGIDERPMETIELGGRNVVCVAISHPSMRNARYRCNRFNTLELEIALLKQAAEDAGVAKT